MKIQLLVVLLLFGVSLASHGQGIDEEKVDPDYEETEAVSIEDSVSENSDLENYAIPDEGKPMFVLYKELKEIIIKLNKGIDKVLHFLREAFGSLGEVGIPLPDINKQIGHPPYAGKIKVTKGYFKNPATIERTGDVQILVRNGTTIILQVQLGLKEAELGFENYNLDILNIHQQEIDVADAEEVQSLSNQSPEPEVEVFSTSPRMEVRAELKPKVERPQSAKISSRATSKARQTPSINSFKREADDSEASDNSEEDDDDDDDIRGPTIDGAYDPKDYEHLQVPGEIKELFEYITYYTPQVIELDYKLEPFVPDYIPAVGDIDGFLKVARPDGKEDMLGIAVLDEPSVAQSDPAVLHLRLRAQSKQSSAKQVVVKKLHNAEKNPKAIDKWVHDIGELHKSKPAPTMEYSRPMPDIDTLMQEWPPEFEQKLNEVGLPLEELDVDLITYVDIICALFDIPCYESRIESLHLLFSLYSAVKNYKNNQNANLESESSDN